MNLRKLFLVIGLTTATMTMSAQSVFDIKLYNGRPPYNNGDESDSAKVRVFLPAEKQATGRAIVICPGGAYETLSMEKEGYDWGEFFQNQGIAAVVLKYRMPHGQPEVPVSDAEQAMKQQVGRLTVTTLVSWVSLQEATLRQPLLQEVKVRLSQTFRFSSIQSSL